MLKKQQRQVRDPREERCPRRPCLPKCHSPRAQGEEREEQRKKNALIGGHPSLSTELVLCGMAGGGELELREAENLLSYMTAEWQPLTAPHHLNCCSVSLLSEAVDIKEETRRLGLSNNPGWKIYWQF